MKGEERMIRNAKALGVALAMVFALGAVTANAASAEPGTLTSDGPVTLIGNTTGEAVSNAFSAFKFEVQCPSAVYTGHKYNVTPHEFLEPSSEKITVTPHFGTCAATGNFPTTIDMNGCDYVIDIGGFRGNSEWSLTTTVVCPKGNHITFTVFGNTTKHTEGKPFCHITVTENAEGYAGLVAKDTENGKVDISGTVANISADQKSPTGSILCPEMMTNEAKRTLDITLEGKNELGAATLISLS
jgi:hypothetical protein